MNATKLPKTITWDINYACQLRCSYCYSESGRRKERRLSAKDMRHVVDILTSIQPRSVQISGGEPTLVDELPELIQRLRTGIPKVSVFINGHDLFPAMAEALLAHATDVHLSLDAGNAAVNDSIRGKPGAFEEALKGLAMLNAIALDRRAQGLSCAVLCIDTVLVRSNFRKLEPLCTEVARQFSALSILLLGPAAPAGLASETAYAETELLLEDELAELRDPRFADQLRALAPSPIQVLVSDNFGLLFSPERIAAGSAMTGMMHIEPDAGVRAIPTCEGRVGNLLLEAPETLWRRAQERWSDPFVTAQLAGVQTMQQWAAATWNIDRHFASPDDLIRLRRRVSSPSPDGLTQHQL